MAAASDSAASQAHNATDERLKAWAQATATADCDAACRLTSTLSAWQASREATEDAGARVCWGCDGHPWSREVVYVRSVWNAIHEEQLPIRAVSQRCNLWSVPCPRGVELRARGARCLAGHFAYAVLCFFRWMGEGNEAYGLLNLESAMDLASLVQSSPCHGDWGFSPAEVAENYENILSSVWHLHTGVPERWLPASGPPRCARERPREPQEVRPAQLPSTRMRVMCMVLAVFPAEEQRMSTVVDTYASHCDSLVFLTASEAPADYRGYFIFDLRQWFPSLKPDPGDWAAGSAPGLDNSADHNTIEKTLRAFEWAALALRGLEVKPDVICRLDSDTMFFPPNLLRIMHCRNFSAEVPWAIGHENYLHKHQQPGRAFLSGGNGICLSRAAVERFDEKLRQGEVHESSEAGDWNSGLCVSLPGHWDDVVFGVCLAQFGIPLSRWGTDCHGRTLFWPHPLASALDGPGRIAPPREPPRVSWLHAPDEEMRARDDEHFANYFHWRYRAWQHFACQPRHWIGDFPVSLHPCRDPEEARALFRAVMEREAVAGYRPKAWSFDFGECSDLISC